MTPSPEQQAYFEWLRHSTGNALIEAVAGSGKTTTLINGLRYMQGTILMMAYNKKAAVDMTEKAKGIISAAEFSTVHAAGFKIMRGNKHYPKEIDEWKRFDALAEKFNIEKEHKPFLKEILSLAKQKAFGVPGQPGFKDEAAWAELVVQFSLEDLLHETQDLPSALALAGKMLQASKYDNRSFIDFDDMIWLPLILEYSPPMKYDWVLLDEAQDTNPARRCLAKLLLKSTGRFVAVGDPAQAIYGFTGADNDSLELIARDFNTTSLPLHTSFRCSKAVIAEAQKYVSHIKAFHANPEGNVSELEIDTSQSWLEGVGVRDVILCRNTRPLISLAFRLIRAGRAAKVEGRKIGEGLKALAKKLKYNNFDQFTKVLDNYRSTECRNLLAKKKNFAAALVQDKCESLIVVAESIGPAFTRERLIARIDEIFAEGVQKGAITLCTIHRSKGLEWDTVYWYCPKQYQPSSFAQQDWEFIQETNLMYVAATRAKSNLVILNRRPD